MSIDFLCRCGLQLPEYILTDEKHSKCRVEKVYLQTITSGRVVWHLRYVTNKSGDAFLESYQARPDPNKTLLDAFFFLVFMNQFFFSNSPRRGYYTVDEIFAYAEKYHKKADQVLDETVKLLKIPPNVKITIDTNGEGGIKVSADLPEDTLKNLEQKLNDHPDFQQHYAKASSSYSFGKTAERQSEFANANDSIN